MSGRRIASNVVTDDQQDPMLASIEFRNVGAHGVDVVLTTRELLDDEPLAAMALHSLMLSCAVRVRHEEGKEAMDRGDIPTCIAAAQDIVSTEAERSAITTRWQARIVCLACRKTGVSPPRDMVEAAGWEQA